MKRSRYAETQIVKILKEAEAGIGVEELSRHLWDHIDTVLPYRNSGRRIRGHKIPR